MHVRLTPLTADGFSEWAASSRAGFAEQQVASGSMPRHEAQAYAERSFDRLLPYGVDTPGQHLWDVRLGADRVGHLWVQVSQHSDGLDAFVLDVGLLPQWRGRGLGRATMLAAECEVGAMGVRRMRLNVFGHNLPAKRLYDGLGYRAVATMLAEDLRGRRAGGRGGTVRPLRLEPMPADERDRYRPLVQRSYAERMASSGMLPAVEARQKAADDWAALLPRGCAGEDHTTWLAYDGGDEVGRLWLQTVQTSDGVQMLAHDLSVADTRYLPGLLLGAEDVSRDRGAVALAVTVFGCERSLQGLLEEAGWSVTARLLRKDLDQGGGSDSPATEAR